MTTLPRAGAYRSGSSESPPSVVARFRRRAVRLAALVVALVLVGCSSSAASSSGRAARLWVLPGAGRTVYLDAFRSATRDIRIEICVLEDPQILAGVARAIRRGVRVRVIVDRSKYAALAAERANLAATVVGRGAELHVSNPVFPRSFPKVIIVDHRKVVVGSACLDQATFAGYRDFATVTTEPATVSALGDLFENDWSATAAPGAPAPPFDPTPPIRVRGLLVGPYNAATGLVDLYASARTTLDVYTELLGNPTLEAALVAAVRRGVRVRLVAPAAVNGATPDVAATQTSAIGALARAGVVVRTSRSAGSASSPYLHARAAIVDGRVAYLGSISLSPDSATVNREVGTIVSQRPFVASLRRQFDRDFAALATGGP
jgi:phosphatidylserine/phosphatidylglycerophosphate/cardiolipin synthase-like enzyme